MKWQAPWSADTSVFRPVSSSVNSAHASATMLDIASQCPDRMQLTALIRYLSDHITHDEAFRVVLVLTDSNPLTDYPHWRHTGRVLRERMRMAATERWTAIYVPLTEATGMHKVHYTWGATFVIEALFASDPTKNYVLWDHDAAPTILYELDDLAEVLLLSTPTTWADGSTAENRHIAVIGIAEKCSPVNACIVYFRKELSPMFPCPADSIEEAVSRVMARRAGIVADAWEQRFPPRENRIHLP